MMISIPDAAQALLAAYKGEPVYAGDAIKLEDAIRKCLVKELGVSEAKTK